MKYTYIIWIKDQETLRPVLIKIWPWNDISYIGRNYWRAYIMESKAQAENVFKDRWETHEKKILPNNQ